MGKLSESIARGLAAARPAVGDVSIGAIYFSTDTLVLERNNGSSWDSISVAGTPAITQLTGDVTAGPGSGSQAATIGNDKVTTAKIINDAVTYAKIQNVTDARLLGRSAGSAGDTQEITIGSGLSLAAGALTASGGSSAWTTEVTKSVDQDVTASSTLADDTELQLAVTANDVWLIELLIIYSATDATRDFLWDVAVSSGTMSGSSGGFHLSSGDVAGAINIAFAAVTNSGDTTSGTAAAHGIRAFKMEYTLFFSATATFKFRFAESSAQAATEARCKAKSRLRAFRMSP